MQDLSRVTGNPVIINFKDTQYRVSGFTFGDVGLLQAEFLKQKRASIMEAAVSLRDVLPAEEAQSMLNRAMTEAATIQYVTEDEFAKLFKSVNGMTLAVWTVLNRQHPGVFTKNDILSLFAAGELNKEKLNDLFAYFNADKQLAKNEIGPTARAAETSP